MLNGGALHFNIRHPQGGQSNYRFVTATSQIAVRGTEGFLIAGANGTQVVCVSCAAGDVTVQVGQQTVSIVTNQTLTVLGSNPLTATTSITANPTVNNPAVNQFNGNQNPFNPNPTGNGVDPTGSFSGAGTGAAGAGAGGVVTTVGAAAAAGAAVSGVATQRSKGPAARPVRRRPQRRHAGPATELPRRDDVPVPVQLAVQPAQRDQHRDVHVRAAQHHHVHAEPSDLTARRSTASLTGNAQRAGHVHRRRQRQRLHAADHDVQRLRRRRADQSGVDADHRSPQYRRRNR